MFSKSFPKNSGFFLLSFFLFLIYLYPGIEIMNQT